MAQRRTIKVLQAYTSVKNSGRQSFRVYSLTTISVNINLILLVLQRAVMYMAAGLPVQVQAMNLIIRVPITVSRMV